MKKITLNFLRNSLVFFLIFTAKNLLAQTPPSVPSSPQYYNSSKKYIQYVPGNMPVIISAPHGGKLPGNELTTRNCGTNEEDNNTDILIKEIQKWCYDQYGIYPYIIVNNLRSVTS